jgi:hypothetical protein
MGSRLRSGLFSGCIGALTALLAWATFASVTVTGTLFTGVAVVIARHCRLAFQRCSLTFCVNKSQLGLLILGRRTITFFLAGATLIAATAATTSTAAFTALARFTGLGVAIGGLGFAFSVDGSAGFVVAFGIVGSLAARCAVGAWTAVTTLCTVTAGCTFRALFVASIHLH